MLSRAIAQQNGIVMRQTLQTSYLVNYSVAVPEF